MDTADASLGLFDARDSENEETCEVTYLNPSERRLLLALRQGDERAFSLLVRSYQDRVYSLSLRMLGNREEAEDLTQEVFVALYQHLDDFRGEAQLSTWIYRVTRNRCLNRLKYLGRRSSRRSTPLEEVGPGRLAEAAATRALPGPDQHLEGVELQEVLERTLLQLPEEQRLMVLLRDVEGLAYERIAEICDLPVGTVKSRLHRARAALAKAVAAATTLPERPDTTVET